MEVSHDNSYISFHDETVDNLGRTEYTKELWDIISNNKWHVCKV